MEREFLADSAIVDMFVSFLETFRNERGDHYYFDQINQMSARREKSLTVHHYDLTGVLLPLLFNTKEAENNLKLLDQAVQNIYKNLFYDTDPGDEEKEELARVNARIAIDDRELLTDLRNIDISHRSKLVAFDSIIVSKSERKSTIKDKVFKCSSCGQVYPRKEKQCLQDDCKSKNIVVSIEDSTLTNCEYVECQERQEDLKTTAGSSSRIPVTVNVKIYGDLVGKFNAGDNVRVIGITKIQKTVSDTVLNRMENDEFSSDLLFDIVIEAHSIQLLSSQRGNMVTATGGDDPASYLTDEDTLSILKLRKTYQDDNDLMNVLVSSFATEVYGHDRIKEAILLQNVGSIETKNRGGVITRRNNINIYLCGDPATSKTMLLQAAATISLNGHMASGKGVTGVGLTASVESGSGNNGNDSIRKLKIGVAVLADRGHLSLDEFSKINEENQAYLLDCMESGTFRINKGGINATLNANASFLIATNPDSGKYNRFNSLFENVTISDQLFSRIHITFVMPDIVNREMDERIADHLLAGYDDTGINISNSNSSKSKSRLTEQQLFRYLVYARINNTKGITFSKEALKTIKDFYHKLRKPEQANDITATPRQLVGIIKLCIARTRLMLRSEVTGDTANAIVSLLTYSYYTAGVITGGGSGGMNLSMEYSKPIHQLKPVQAFAFVFLKLSEDNTIPVKKDDIILELMEKAKWDKDFAFSFFEKMEVSNRLLAQGKSTFLLMDKHMT